MNYNFGGFGKSSFAGKRKSKYTIIRILKSEDEKNIKSISLVALLSLYISCIFSILLFGYKKYNFAYCLFGFGAFVFLALMVFIKIKYPKSECSKIILWSFVKIILYAAVLIFIGYVLYLICSGLGS